MKVFEVGDIVYIRKLSDESTTGQTKLIRTVFPKPDSEFRLVSKVEDYDTPGWWVVEEVNPEADAITWEDHSGLKFVYVGQPKGYRPPPAKFSDYWMNGECNENCFVLKETAVQNCCGQETLAEHYAKHPYDNNNPVVLDNATGELSKLKETLSCDQGKCL